MTEYEPYTAALVDMDGNVIETVLITADKRSHTFKGLKSHQEYYVVWPFEPEEDDE